MSPPSAFVELTEGVERHHAAVFGSEPSRPVLARHVADVGGSAIGLHPQQFLEINGLALGLKLVGALLGGIHQRLGRRRHAPPRRGEFAALGSVAHDRRRVVWKHTGHRRQIADISVDDAKQRDDGGLIGRNRVEVMPTSA